MWSELVVSGLGVFEDAELALTPGSVALTGETGAGKTLLIAAAQLLAGGRAGRSLVRQGAAEARVEGRFLVPPAHPSVDLLQREGVLDEPAGPDEVDIVISRTVAAAGKGTRVRVNGRIVPLSLLAQLGSSLMEIAGQHEHQRLGSPAHQRALLDSFIGSDALRLAAEVKSSVRALAGLTQKLEGLRSGAKERSRELDLLRYEIAEIQDAGLREGESRELQAVADRLEHAEMIAAGAGGAADVLRGEGGVADLVAEAESRLGGAVAKDPSLGPLATRLEACRYEIVDIASELAAHPAAPDPDALEEVRARLALIAHLRRKYGGDESELLSYLRQALARAEELEGPAGDQSLLEEERARLLASTQAASARLSELRVEHAPLLAAAVEARLEELALPGASFEVSLVPRDVYEGGGEEVRFLIAPNPGEAPLPVARSASGGELSRIALALHLVTTTGPVRTMIFDEVDAGVGGEAARAVGSALAELARSAEIQVLVVTHLPQIAALAGAQYRVRKQQVNGRTVAVVERVEGDERVEELSRMLAGLPESDVAREHARELLDLAAAGSRA